MTDSSTRDLSAAKQALLARRLAERAAARASVIPPRGDRERAVLSFAQEEFWLQEERASGLTANNLVNVWRLRGPLNEAAMQRALDMLVRRHEVLRTTIALGATGAEQRITEPQSVELQIVDLVAAEGDREARAFGVIEEWAGQTYNLSRDPLLRAGVVRIAQDDRLFFLMVHHIAADGVTLGVLREELAALYAAAVRGEGDSLAPVAVQYGDYAAWQRDPAQQARLDALVERWRRRLADAPEGLNLPIDRPRAAVSTFRGGSSAITLSPTLLASLRTVAHEHGATPFMVLFAGFAALLARYSGQDDLVIGVPVAGRERPELARAAGLYANSVAVRADVSNNPTFVDFLGRIRTAALDAFEDQDVPFGLVNAALRAGGRPADAPVIQVICALQDDAANLLPLEGVTAEPVGVALSGTKFELTLLASERPEGLRIALQHRIDLFDMATIERMLGHFERLITAAVTSPLTHLADLPMMDLAERALLLKRWNDTDAHWPEQATIHGLFEEQVRLRPDAVAVQCNGDCLTYAELDRRANQLAWRLREKGVVPDALVAVCMEKSLDTVVALLGILKAGGAYVPIDPAYPDDRIAYVLSDCRAGLVVTETALVARLGALQAEVILAVDATTDLPSVRDVAPPSVVRPANLCYVIYTSGSTGHPKGVLVEHRNVVRLLFNDRFQFDFSERDVWTVFHSFAFDFSVWEMYGALLRGGRLIVIPRHVAQRSSDYLDLLVGEGVTVLNQVPSAFFVLMAEELTRPAARLRLRYVIFGGEALQPALLKPWKARYPATRLINMFGITETTVHVTFKELQETDITRGTSNIGRPIPTLTTYILDERLDLVPMGVPGEICVGGAGVTRGYLDRPELTAERFVPHPFRPSERLYRSGDMGRMHSSGEIEYLGRRDAQLKLRGFRIEPGEIESALSGHPAVAHSAVVLRGERGGEVVGYIVPDVDHAGAVRRLIGMETRADTATLPRFELSNGMTVFHRNRSETEFLFKEIFDGDGYLGHGLTIGDDDVVFDVGANIGMFTLFAGTGSQNVRVYSFEPIPPVHEVLRANAELHGIGGRVFACGLGSRAETVSFTYYPQNTVLSGRFASKEAETETVRQYFANVDSAPGKSAPLEELLSHTLRSEEFACQIRTLSDVVREEGIERIDLLKVDVEKAEWDVLLGITDSDWPKIRQVVIEVHDLEGRLAQVLDLLRGKGFECVADQDSMLIGTTLYAVHAWRPRDATTVTAPSTRLTRWSSQASLRQELRQHLALSLPEYMIPAAFVFLDALPLTPSGKLDRRALPAPQHSAPEEDLPPQGPVEQVVASVWCEALQLPRVGRSTSFLELGGHSLLVTRVVAALSKLLRVQLPVRIMFDSPTVAGLAAALIAHEKSPGQTVKVAQLVVTLQSRERAPEVIGGDSTQVGSHA